MISTGTEKLLRLAKGMFADDARQACKDHSEAETEKSSTKGLGWVLLAILLYFLIVGSLSSHFGMP